MDRALRREDDRQEQDGAELADRSSAEQIGPKRGVELAAVRQDRDQGADRGGRDRRARVQDRHGDPDSVEHADGGVSEHQRHQPSEQPEA